MAEIILTENDFLISETDYTGKISYVNSDFLRISGYSKKELLHHTHNIVRHEMTPPEIFSDLWKTIQNGETWSGVLKNKTKNGDYYWVYATVSPLHMNDGSIGYISCRKKASDAMIQSAEKYYVSKSTLIF